MKSNTIAFTAENTVEYQVRDFTIPARDDFIVVQTESSIVSAATELACLRGSESWAPYPFVPGYGSVGIVTEVGRTVTHVRPGDRVLTYGRHEQFSLARTVVETIPATLKGERAVFARMAAIAMTALRVADAELGDKVCVIGLGLVGNFAAQLFTLAGCDVIGVDPSASRRRRAEQCRIFQTLAPGEHLEEEIKALTGGRKCRSVVDATGLPAVIEKAPALAGRNGELILLGSPRGGYRTDLTPFLNYSHLAGCGSITIKGAHEYRFPAKEDPSQHYRHSFQSNVRTILDRIADGRLYTDVLLTHRPKPETCAAIYRELRERPDECMGIVFDWSA